MKKIGIIFAMDEEINAFKKYINIDKEYDIFDLHFCEGIIFDNNFVLATSGVGKVNAARTTQILIDNYDVDYIINVGVAGGVKENLLVALPGHLRKCSCWKTPLFTSLVPSS